QLQNVSLKYFPKEGDPHYIWLPADYVTGGRKLVPGKYEATYYTNGRTLTYLPVYLDKDSPEMITFRLPPTVVYRGRVVHGVTGKPLPRSWVAGTYAVARGNLALLSPDDWRNLREMPNIAKPGDPATKILQVHYGV